MQVHTCTRQAIIDSAVFPPFIYSAMCQFFKTGFKSLCYNIQILIQRYLTIQCFRFANNGELATEAIIQKE